jgi:fructose-1,6-bisphosphatase I
MKFFISTLLVVTLSSAAAFQAPHNSNAPTRKTASSSLNVATTARIKVPVLDEVCETTGVTLKRYMNEVAMLNPEMTELVTLFGAVETACKAIANLVKRSQLPSSETLGYQGEVNVQGEDQKKLDVITNDLLKRALRFTGRIGVLASEEEDVPVSYSYFYPCRTITQIVSVSL